MDINQEGVNAAAAGIRAQGARPSVCPVDIRDYAQVKAAVALALEKFGRIDIMVNCAGGASSRGFGRSEPFPITNCPSRSSTGAWT